MKPSALGTEHGHMVVKQGYKGICCLSELHGLLSGVGHAGLQAKDDSALGSGHKASSGRTQPGVSYPLSPEILIGRILGCLPLLYGSHSPSPWSALLLPAAPHTPRLCPSCKNHQPLDPKQGHCGQCWVQPLPLGNKSDSRHLLVRQRGGSHVVSSVIGTQVCQSP
jgi:hypothetical protein